MLASGVAYAACRNTGNPLGANIATGAALGFTAAKAAVKVSQAPAAQAAGKHIAAGAKKAGACIGALCTAAGKKIDKASSAVGKAGSKLIHGKQTPVGHHVRSEPKYRQLVSRKASPEPEPEFVEDLLI